MPSLSLTLITDASTASPILNRSASFSSFESVIWSLVITPVTFVPRSRRISFSEIDITVPVTVAPVYIFTFAPFSHSLAKSSAKLSSLISLIVSFTSIIKLSGVDAPAVIPILIASPILPRSISFFV